MSLLAILTLPLLFAVIRSQPSDSDQDQNLWDTYSKCRANISRPPWICDPYGKLSKDASDQIDILLWRLQTDVPCYCADDGDCYRLKNVSIKSGIVGALVVTTNFSQNVDNTAKRIYQDARLGASPSCDNGLLLIYAVNGRNLYVLRGGLVRQIIYTSDAAQSLDEAQTDLQTKDYNSGLPDLLRLYIWRLQKSNETRVNWDTAIGICVAVAIVSFVIAILLSICFSTCCSPRKSFRPSMPPDFEKQEKEYKKALSRVIRRRNHAIARYKAQMDAPATITGRPVTPKRLASAKRNLFRKKIKKQRKIYEQDAVQQQQRGLLTPSSGSDEQYYVISEPGSAIYAPYTVQTTLQAGASGGDSPYATGTLRPSSTQGFHPPAILYPNSSQAVFNAPSPKRETQRKDFYVGDERRNSQTR